mmetsp:Transcript_10553/g.34950  ORF Transcript_10553/g.34950 Transcript_10553/m.34950 type:complete len:211 (-) Transcript_10553:9-641(-)
MASTAAPATYDSVPNGSPRFKSAPRVSSAPRDRHPTCRYRLLPRIAHGIDAAAAAITAHLTPVPASNAYAHDCGIATHAVEMPAMMSWVMVALFCAGVDWVLAAAAASAMTPLRGRGRELRLDCVWIRLVSPDADFKTAVREELTPATAETTIAPARRFKQASAKNPDEGRAPIRPGRGPLRAPARTFGEAIATNAIANVANVVSRRPKR